MSEIWYGLKHSAEIRRLFAGMVGSFLIAAGVPTFLVLNYFFEWYKPL